MPQLIKRSQGILTVSEFSKASIIERFKYPERLITAIPLGVDHDRFKVHTKDTAGGVLSKFKIQPGYLFTLGSIFPRKNLSRMLQAWSKAQANLPDEIEFVVAGDIPERGTINANIPPRTRIIGRVSDEDLPSLLSCAGAFIFASLYEGFGLPPLEAMASGTPCIVSNTTAMPEVVGDAVALIDPTDVSDISNVITAVLSDHLYQQHLRVAGLERASSFTWAKTAKLTVDFLSRF